jgi:Fe-S cluster assembly protein SufD
LPASDEEVWRYSRIDELDLEAWTPATPPAGEERLGGDASSFSLGETAARVTVVDGFAQMADGGSVAEERGLRVEMASRLDEADAGLGAVMAKATDALAELNDAFSPDPLVIRVPAGMVVEHPVEVVHRITSEGRAAFPRVVVRVGEGAQVTVVERMSSADVAALVVPVTEIDVGRGGRLAYVSVQELGPRVWQIASQVSQVGQEATFVSAAAGLGGDYARLRTDCRLTGRGASGELLAAYFGEGHQTLDFRTFQDHRARDTTSNLLFKGAVGGHSRSVYTGLIKVRKEARGTNAFQTNRNIKLSDHAWAESVPNLEIENNEVSCSHASAVGPVDDEQRFYLESRGVPPQVAERLVVAGFFDDVISRIPVDGLAAPLRARIAAKLDRQEW